MALKPKVTTALKESWQNQTDRWEGKAKAFCKSCQQWTSTVDKHSATDKPAFLHWVHNRVSKLQIKEAQAKLEAAAKTAAGKTKKVTVK